MFTNLSVSIRVVLLSVINEDTQRAIKAISSILRRMADDSICEVKAGRSLGARGHQLTQLYGEWWQALWRTHVHNHPSPTTMEQLEKESELQKAMLDVVWNLAQFIQLR